jgi:ring-1,2-phenylacetyl-CoA epoxidase subunit PaaC
MSNDFAIKHLLYLGDNSLILAQRNGEWCGHGPILEQDIAITNISLDLLGQARNFYQHAADLLGGGATEDSLAYLRTEREFVNCLLVEQPNGDWAKTILRQCLFSQYQYLLYQQLSNSSDEQVTAIVEKSLKEVAYHVRWSSEWVIRLGDGTTESHNRIQHGLDELWPYTGEMFEPADFERGVDLASVKKSWTEKIQQLFTEATIVAPSKVYMQTGGKQGKHTEHLGFILAEMQYMQRAYPGAEW